mgnify:CR=1 FL=1
MGTKNNPKNRGAANTNKVVGGKEVKPVAYMGKMIGHGNYIAAQDAGGNMILDASGKPIPYGDIVSEA